MSAMGITPQEKKKITDLKSDPFLDFDTVRPVSPDKKQSIADLFKLEEKALPLKPVDYNRSFESTATAAIPTPLLPPSTRLDSAPLSPVFSISPTFPSSQSAMERIVPQRTHSRQASAGAAVPSLTQNPGRRPSGGSDDSSNVSRVPEPAQGWASSTSPSHSNHNTPEGARTPQRPPSGRHTPSSSVDETLLRAGSKLARGLSPAAGHRHERSSSYSGSTVTPRSNAADPSPDPSLTPIPAVTAAMANIRAAGATGSPRSPARKFTTTPMATTAFRRHRAVIQVGPGNAWFRGRSASMGSMLGKSHPVSRLFFQCKIQRLN
ncbi:hypothetical protein DFS34DRAFT_266557 [Phlyctochytrium arcticum]|nr:hypothetical protein DFS34DRAFT_266557 [Phlyctochytrium arcticum]